MATYTLTDYLDKDALAAVLRQDNKAKLNTLRNNVPFHFLQHLTWDIKPNIYSAITNGDNNPVAARVINYNTASQTHQRPDLEELILEKFPIAANRQLTEKQAIDLSHSLQRASEPVATIMRQMFDDVNWTKMAIYERFEYYFLQVLSSGKIVLDATTNNGGLATTIDYDLPAVNQHTGAAKWSVAGSGTPLADIKAVVEDCNDRGFFPTKIFMTQTQFNYMVATTEFTNVVMTTLTSGSSAKLIGLPQVNQIFSVIGLPEIVIIKDAVFAYNAGNVRTKITAWDADTVVFGNDGTLGTVAVATPPTDLLANSSNPIWGIDQVNGILTTLKSEEDPITIKTQSRIYGMVNIPAVYDFQYLDINP